MVEWEEGKKVEGEKGRKAERDEGRCLQKVIFSLARYTSALNCKLKYK
jgi:hypothetical protein